MSFGAEVVADSSGKFCGNQIRFATKMEAELYARDLMRRWTLVVSWRIVEYADPVNYKIVDGVMTGVGERVDHA